MDLRAYATLLESLRDHLTIALHHAQRGDMRAAVEETEAAAAELEQLAEELRT